MGPFQGDYGLAIFTNAIRARRQSRPCMPLKKRLATPRLTVALCNHLKRKRICSIRTRHQKVRQLSVTVSFTPHEKINISEVQNPLGVITICRWNFFHSIIYRLRHASCTKLRRDARYPSLRFSIFQRIFTKNGSKEDLTTTSNHFRLFLMTHQWQACC